MIISNILNDLINRKRTKISHLWDGLIERFNKSILNDTQYETTGRGVAHSERPVRFLAREPRARRRFLTAKFIDLYRTFGVQSWKAVHVIEPSSLGDPYYVFMVMRHPERIPYIQYRKVRAHCLFEYAQAVKVVYPEVKDIVGIGTGPPDDNDPSEDVLYLDTRLWTEEDQCEAERVQQETGYLRKVIPHEAKIKAYPDLAPRPNPQSGKGPKGRDRNKPCHCGSTRKIKHCCGR